jgi:sodium-dependent dicarboxylate transporter 2/3/5
MKFVFKPDVSPLKNITIEMIEKNPLPPMNKAQKTYGVFLVIFVAMMLLPSLIPQVPLFAFLNANSLILPGVLVMILCLISFEDGPVLKMGEVMGKDFAWPTYWLCVAAIYIGGVLTDASTGIVGFLNVMLAPIFNGMSGTVFTIVLLIVTVVLTNISNSLVIGMILQPVILTYCATANVNPAPIITLAIFTVLLSAACTPAASPFAAMLFGNKEYLTSGDVYKYSLTFVLVEVVLILLVGIPFINMLI